jgi:predicted MFS family arabinose efflux permease
MVIAVQPVSAGQPGASQAGTGQSGADLRAASPIGASAATAGVSRRGWYALVVMLLIFSCHFLDRAVLSLVAEPVRKEFGLSDSQLGVLNGFAFGVMFAIAGIPIGLMVDRINRSKLLACMVFLWSSATAACGLAQSYVWLLAGRMAVGAAESGGAPTSLSLMSDYFPPPLRSTAVGIYYLGGAVGGLMCYLVGSQVAAHFGWRAALFVAGVPGITLAVLAFTTLHEPKRGATEAPATGIADGSASGDRPVGLGRALQQIAANRALLYLFGAAPLTSAAAAAAGAWLPPFFMRSHGMDIGTASLILGIAGGGFGALGSTLGGAIADRVARRDATRRTGFGACVMLAAIPALLIATLSVANMPAIAFTFVSFALIFAALPVSFGSMLTLTAPRIRGITSATMQGACNLLGFGLGPLGVGVLSDHFGGPSSLRYALAIVSTGCCLGAALCFLLARRAIRAGRDTMPP